MQGFRGNTHKNLKTHKNFGPKLKSVTQKKFTCNLVDTEKTQKNVLYLLIILKLKLSANDKENENNQKTPVKAEIKVAKNINTMLKEVSINKKKIKDKNALASNDSVIV